MTTEIHIGTCSWKYPSWRGLVYSDKPGNYLQEYAQKYDCVEVDQWFWSLYGPDKVVLPQPKAVAEYAASVPDTFRFALKMPNALTMTHFHQAAKTDPLVPNPHFLSLDVLRTFLDRLEPMREKLGPLMFQFPYLNKKMMPSQAEFLEKLGAFVSQLPADYTWCIESRNPNYLKEGYFAFLQEHGLAHVFLQGYYMPPIVGVYPRTRPGSASGRPHSERRAGCCQRPAPSPVEPPDGGVQQGVVPSDRRWPDRPASMGAAAYRGQRLLWRVVGASSPESDGVVPESGRLQGGVPRPEECDTAPIQRQIAFAFLHRPRVDRQTLAVSASDLRHDLVLSWVRSLERTDPFRVHAGIQGHRAPALRAVQTAHHAGEILAKGSHGPIPGVR